MLSIEVQFDFVDVLVRALSLFVEVIVAAISSLKHLDIVVVSPSIHLIHVYKEGNNIRPKHYLNSRLTDFPLLTERYSFSSL